MVPQDPFAALNPLAQVGAQLRETLAWVAGLPRAAAEARARALLAQVGLGADPDAVLAAYPHQLSGGMAQRVAIALTLAPGPKLVVADEPTAALDPARGRAILELLAARARDQGTAVLLITHDLAAVAPVARRVAVLAGGRIVEDAPASRRSSLGPATRPPGCSSPHPSLPPASAAPGATSPGARRCCGSTVCLWTPASAAERRASPRRGGGGSCPASTCSCARARPWP